MAEYQNRKQRRDSKKSGDGTSLMDRIGRFFKQANEQSGIGQIRKENAEKAKANQEKRNSPEAKAEAEKKRAEQDAKNEKFKKKSAENRAERDANKRQPTGADPLKLANPKNKTAKTTTSSAGKTSASSFKAAFAKARKAYQGGKGGSTFEWNGKKYSVATKDDIKKSGKKDLKEYLNAGMTPKRK